MKKIYNESEHEIRRLKRENISMHTELEACSSIFCNADKIYQGKILILRFLYNSCISIKQLFVFLEKLYERVRYLLNQNEDLERKLTWTQERLTELAKEKGVLFLDSMLSFCKYELKKRVTTCVEYLGNFLKKTNIITLPFKRFLL